MSANRYMGVALRAAGLTMSGALRARVAQHPQGASELGKTVALWGVARWTDGGPGLMPLS